MLNLNYLNILIMVPYLLLPLRQIESTRKFQIVLLFRSHDSPDMPESEATFAITAGGINDAKD